jgi:hypothetical protein
MRSRQRKFPLAREPIPQMSSFNTANAVILAQPESLYWLFAFRSSPSNTANAVILAQPESLYWLFAFRSSPSRKML